MVHTLNLCPSLWTGCKMSQARRFQWPLDCTKICGCFLCRLRLESLNFVVVQLLSHVWLFATPDGSTPGFPVLHYLPMLPPTHVHWFSDATVASFSCPQSFPASGAFPMSQFFTSGGQSIGASASASGLPIYIQGWFPVRLAALIWTSTFTKS